MFWGGGRLQQSLPALISGFRPDRVDGASYRLSIGPEIYVSPTGEPDDPRNKPKKRLEQEEGFTIPPGQFGYILTEEVVKVPVEAIALISIRAKYKFRGLVNVSGFHVDPNYSGRLLFSVFNAGPSPVHLSRGEECFLIWYADLDQPSNVPLRQGFENIPSELTGPLANGLQSFASLLAKINENDKKIEAKVNALQEHVAVVKWAVVLAVGALVSLAIKDCSSAQLASHSKPVSASHSGPTVSPKN